MLLLVVPVVLLNLICITNNTLFLTTHHNIILELYPNDPQMQTVNETVISDRRWSTSDWYGLLIIENVIFSVGHTDMSQAMRISSVTLNVVESAESTESPESAPMQTQSRCMSAGLSVWPSLHFL